MATTTTSKKKSTKKTTTKARTKKPAAKKRANSAAVSKKTSTSKKSSPKAKKIKSATKTSTASTSSKVTAQPTAKTSGVKDKFKKLNVWNYVLALLHAAQGVAIIVLSKSDSLFPVNTTFMTQDTLASSEGAPVLVQAQRSLFDVNLAYIVAAFFFMSAIAHIIVATVYRKRYEANLNRGINRVRWYEYAVSASTMMVGIALLSGVSDLSTLVMIFGATAVMNLCGLVMEVHNQTTAKTNWLSYIVGSFAGLGPWVVIGIYFFGTNQYGSGSIPTFVYAIYASIFLFFMSFAVNMYLQYKGKGKWSDYLFGEKAYMVLSLVAKSALAWQIFVGTLRP
jgi:hypothetical protein